MDIDEVLAWLAFLVKNRLHLDFEVISRTEHVLPEIKSHIWDKSGDHWISRFPAVILSPLPNM